MFARSRRAWDVAAEVFARNVIRKLDRRTLILVATVLVVEVSYAFLGSTGHWTHWPLMEKRIDELAESFRAGHLHLLIEPSRALVQAANPFDPANASLWYWDASLYGGHYYFYWGPVPGLLLALVKIVLRVSRPLGDYYPFFGLLTLQLVAGTLLIDRLARRLFPEVSPWRVAGAVLVFAFANPTPFMLGRPAIYEAAVVGGQAFLLFGLLFAFDAVNAAETRAKANLSAFASGTAFALALGCRISLGGAVAAIAAATAWFVARRGRGPRAKRLVEVLVAIGLPLSLGVAALLAYNRLRFDHWFEFGQRYQLTWIAWVWSPAFGPANLYSYALRGAHLACQFPFVTAVTDMGTAAFPEHFQLAPRYFIYEPTIGLLSSVPWVWFSPAALLWRRRLGGSATVELPALVVNLVFAAALGLAPVLFAPSATMRYLGDFAAPLVLLGTIGAWNLRRLTATRPIAKRVLIAASLLLATLTISIGFALGFTGYYSIFQATNPSLMSKLELVGSVCGR
ncbi:MAG TPA: hypothetical protein VLC06_15270 [Polyangia bacterium]|nr:hypothetical protein [Polyangia bacterium]